MKYLFIILLSLLATAGFAQSKADYADFLGEFKRVYNQSKGDSIITMFAKADEARESGMWTKDRLKYLHKEFGVLRSFNYVGEEDGVVLFRTIFLNSVHIMGTVLDENKKLTVFHFKVNTPQAKNLLGNNP